MDEEDSSLLEIAANNDVEGFKKLIDHDPTAVDEVGLWYGREKGKMVLQHRSPLMVAATYGSIDVITLILSVSSADVNRSCGADKTTALHCAASGGSEHAVQAVKLLLSAGADRDVIDGNGRRPADVIVVSPKLTDVKFALEELLGCVASTGMTGRSPKTLRVLTSAPKSNSDDDVSPDSISSPMNGKLNDLQTGMVFERREYPVDPSLPDIKNSIYSTDEFRMFSFKVRPCSRAYSHDWTECPFVHPGENARRRDPRKYHYSCVPCPDFRKGTCRRGDMCEYAHGVFECWLHPAQYRTRLCKDGTSCARRVCFFAHTNEELRPLYMSTGSAVPSPRASASPGNMMELAAAMGLMPGSPSALSAAMSSYTPPMSPSGGNGSMGGWPQPNVPALHLPGSSLTSSRLRSSLSARDIPADDFLMMADFEAQQLLNDLSASRRSKTMAPSNLDDLFSGELSLSPRYNTEQGAMFSPSHKSAILHQFQQQHQSMLSPINTGVFSPKSIDHQHSSLLQASRGIGSPGRMSPRSVEPVSPMSSRPAAFAQREKQQQNLRSLSSRDLGSRTSALVGSPADSAWSNWGSPSGMLDWGVDGEELGRLRRSSSFDLRAGGEDPDVSWVQSLVKESPGDKTQGMAVPVSSVGSSVPVSTGDGNGSNTTPQMDAQDHAAALGAWLEQMQLDQMVV